MADLGQQPNRKRSRVFLATMTLAAVAAVAGLSACSQPSDSQPPTAQRQAAEEQARRDTDEKAWADAEKTGTVAAYTSYLQNFGSGAHVAEASQRVRMRTRRPGLRPRRPGLPRHTWHISKISAVARTWRRPASASRSKPA